MAKHSNKMFGSRPAKAGLVFAGACVLAVVCIGAVLLMAGLGGFDAGSHDASSSRDAARQEQAFSKDSDAQDEAASRGAVFDDAADSDSESSFGFGSDSADNNDTALGRASYSIEPRDMAKVRNKKGEVFSFVLAGSDAPAKPRLSETELKPIGKAVDRIEQAGNSVGFVLVDANAGTGLGYNINQKIYGASSIKASAVAWVLQSYVDKGKASLGKAYPSGIYNKQGNLTVTGSKKLSALMENTLVHSDNADYLALRADFELGSYAKWLEKCGVDGSIGVNDTDFPHYSAKQAACMWLSMTDYMSDGSKNAKKLDKWLGSTEFSYLRHALKGVDGVKVRNKAGWCAIPPDYYGCCDNGYVTVGDDAYVLCIMTDAAGSADYTSGSSKRLMSLAKSVFSARGCLM